MVNAEVEPRVSMRLVLPCLRALRGHPAIPSALLAQLEALDADARLPAGAMIELLAGAVALTGDPDLGLRVGRTFELRDYDALGYVATRGTTVRQGIEDAIAHAHWLDGAARFELELRDERAFVWLHACVHYPRVAAEARSAAIFSVVRKWLGSEPSSAIELWFEHAEPACLQGYFETFGAALLRFGARANAIVFPAPLLDEPLRTADEQLHRIACSYVRGLLDRLPASQSISHKARQCLHEALSSGTPRAEALAHALHMSTRTLARRLEEEGTSFSQLLDDVRRVAALEYLESTRLGTCEIAFKLGFTHPAPFVRAFRRWTGTTPQRHRKQRYGAA